LASLQSCGRGKRSPSWSRFSSSTPLQSSSTPLGDGFTLPGDCDDGNAAIHPGAPEILDLAVVAGCGMLAA
jgi:putative metal-binding protein